MKSFSMAPLILVADDDVNSSEAISRYLKNVGYRVVCVKTICDASRFLAQHFTNFMIINRVIENECIGNFMEQLRKAGQSIPSIVLLDEDLQTNRLHALEFADDVMDKPFHLRELEARMRAVLRRAARYRDWNLTENVALCDRPFIFCGAQVLPSALILIFSNGERKKIGKRELGLMALFHSLPNLILSRKDIIHRVWGVHANLHSRSLDQYIVRIRQLFHGKEHGIDTLLRTVHGVGYLYTPFHDTSISFATRKMPTKVKKSAKVIRFDAR